MPGFVDSLSEAWVGVGWEGRVVGGRGRRELWLVCKMKNKTSLKLSTMKLPYCSLEAMVITTFSPKLTQSLTLD